MTPEQFTQELRSCVRKDFPAYLDFIKRSIADGQAVNEVKLRSFLGDPGGALAGAGLVNEKDIGQINRVVLAAYNSRDLHEYMMKATVSFQYDEHLLDQFKRLASRPEEMPEAEILEVLNRLLRDDAFVTGPIRIILTDPGIRKALEIPESLTADDYLQSVRKAIRDANTLQDVLDVSRVGPGRVMVCNIGVACAVGIAAIVTLAAVVHTSAVAVNYVAAFAVLKTTVVFTVAGTDTLAGTSANRIPQSSAPVRSNCINQSSRTAWLVVRNNDGYVRVPVPPGGSSAGMGLSAVVALLIGGRFNPVNAAIMPDAKLRETGAYVLAGSEESPAIITLHEHESHVVISANGAQTTAERAGVAGWFDSDGDRPPIAAGVAAFRMSEIAAGAPAGADLAGLINESLNDYRFYSSLRAAGLAEAVKKSIQQGPTQ